MFSLCCDSFCIECASDEMNILNMKYSLCIHSHCLFVVINFSCFRQWADCLFCLVYMLSPFPIRKGRGKNKKTETKKTLQLFITVQLFREPFCLIISLRGWWSNAYQLASILNEIFVGLLSDISLLYLEIRIGLTIFFWVRSTGTGTSKGTPWST